MSEHRRSPAERGSQDERSCSGCHVLQRRWVGHGGKAVAERHGTENLILLFADVNGEHGDNRH